MTLIRKLQNIRVLFLTTLWCLQMACPAQHASSSAEAASETTIHVATDLIQLPVVAFLPPHRLVAGLTRQEFLIRLDGGVPFHPQYARLQAGDALSLVLVVQADRRFSYELAKDLRQNSASWGRNLFNDSDQISLDAFDCRLISLLQSDNARLAFNSGQVMTHLSVAALQQTHAEKEQCVALPLVQIAKAALNQLSSARGWRVVVFLLRGDLMPDTRGLETVRALAAATNATIFAVKYLPSEVHPASVFASQEPVNALADSLGGMSVYTSFEDLPSVLGELVASLRQRYILSFPRPGNGGEGAHRIDVSSSVKKVLIRSSAASAPVINEDLCKQFPDTWICSRNRPEYGPSGLGTADDEKK